MGSIEIDLYDIAHVKVEFIPVMKIYTIPTLGRFDEVLILCTVKGVQI